MAKHDETSTTTAQESGASDASATPDEQSSRAAQIASLAAAAAATGPFERFALALFVATPSDFRNAWTAALADPAKKPEFTAMLDELGFSPTIRRFVDFHLDEFPDKPGLLPALERVAKAFDDAYRPGGGGCPRHVDAQVIVSALQTLDSLATALASSR